MRIVLTGGNGGGHLTPLIAVADALQTIDREKLAKIPKSRNGSIEIRYVGVVTPLDKQMLQEASIPFEHISSGKIRRYASGIFLTIFDLLFRFPWGVIRALWRMYVLMPEAVFSKGGYGSVPIVIACWIYRIPVLLHETDVIAGLSNRRLGRFVTAVAVGFRKTESAFPSDRTFVAGTPVRSMFYHPPSRQEARSAFSLHDRKPVLFVVGGSQGSSRINNVILELLVRFLPEFQIIHQVGPLHIKPIQGLIKDTFSNFPDIGDYRPYGFMSEEEMVRAYASANVVISRAGGTTLAEIAAVGRASILIPLRESAGNHQWENAYLFRESGAALVVDEENLVDTLLESTIRELFRRPDQIVEMESNVKQLARPSAAEDIANLLISMGSGYAPRKRDMKQTASATQS